MKRKIDMDGQDLQDTEAKIRIRARILILSIVDIHVN
jgi:hypothetical protein